MAGVTSPLAFPYPTGTDRVADGDNAIQALAESVDDYLVTHHSGSQAAIAPTGATNFGGGCLWAKRSQTVWVQIQMSTQVIGSPNWTFLTLPAGARPFWDTTFLVIDQSKAMHLFWVNTAGAVYSGDTFGAGTQLWGSGVFQTN